MSSNFTDNFAARFNQTRAPQESIPDENAAPVYPFMPVNDTMSEEIPPDFVKPEERQEEEQICVVPIITIHEIVPSYSKDGQKVRVVYQSLLDAKSALETKQILNIEHVSDYSTALPPMTVNFGEFMRKNCTPFPEEAAKDILPEVWSQYLTIGLMPRLKRFIDGWLGEDVYPNENPFRQAFYGPEGVFCCGMDYQSVQKQLKYVLEHTNNRVYIAALKYSGPALVLTCVNPENVAVT